MPTYVARVQYPWKVWYEQVVEVQADSEEEARTKAIKLADNNGWDGAYSLDGEAGDTEVWEITEKKADT